MTLTCSELRREESNRKHYALSVNNSCAAAAIADKNAALTYLILDRWVRPRPDKLLHHLTVSMHNCKMKSSPLALCDAQDAATVSFI